jgi:hypothetical protein
MSREVDADVARCLTLAGLSFNSLVFPPPQVTVFAIPYSPLAPDAGPLNIWTYVTGHLFVATTPLRLARSADASTRLAYFAALDEVPLARLVWDQPQDLFWLEAASALSKPPLSSAEPVAVPVYAVQSAARLLHEKFQGSVSTALDVPVRIITVPEVTL